MLVSKSSQFTISPTGEILWQEKINNPVPGVAIARLVKGVHALKPTLNILENEHTQKQDTAALENHLKLWVVTHFQEILEPLVLLESD